MKNNNVKAAMLIALMVAGCSSVGKDFCVRSGYQKGTDSFEQCVSRVDANEGAYRYCSETKAITAEGAKLNQCLKEADNIYSQYSANSSTCKSLSDQLTPSNDISTHKENQMMIASNQVVSTVVTINEPMSYSQRRDNEEYYYHSCMNYHGWKDRYAWYKGKENVKPGNVIKKLNELKKSQGQNVITPNFTALHRVAANGDMNAVRSVVLNDGVNPNSQNFQGYTALHFAAIKGQVYIVRFLIEELGADPNIKGHNGETVLEFASISGNRYLIDYMINLVQNTAAPAAAAAAAAPAPAPSDNNQLEDKLKNQIKKWF